MSGSIIIKGAREHKLKHIDVEIPRDKLVVRGQRDKTSMSSSSRIQ
jgi:excinuclease UvrABC ATPase subunit